MGPYDVLRYYVGPPLIILGATAGVQLLAWLGADSSSVPWNLTGNANAWMTVGVTLLWAFMSLWVSVGDCGL